MKVGDLVRVPNVNAYDPWCEVTESGYLLQIIAMGSEGYYIIVLEGPYLGVEHWVSGEDLEVISETRR